MQLMETNVNNSDEWTIREKLAFVSYLEKNANYDWNMVAKFMTKNNNNPSRPSDFFTVKQCAAQFETLLGRDGQRQKRGLGMDRSTQLRQLVVSLTTELMEETRLAKQQQNQDFRRIRKELDSLLSGHINPDQVQLMVERARAEDKQLGLTDDDPLFQDIGRRLQQIKWEGRGGIWDSMRPPTTPSTPSMTPNDPLSQAGTPAMPVAPVEQDEDLPLAALLPSPAAPTNEMKTPVKSQQRSSRSSPRKTGPDGRRLTAESSAQKSPSVEATVTPSRQSRRRSSTMSSDVGSPTDSEPLAKLRSTRQSDAGKAADESPAPIRISIRPPVRSISTASPHPLASVKTEDGDGDSSEGKDVVDPVTPDYKQWKSMILTAWRSISGHRHAGIFSQAVSDKEARGYSKTIKHPMDLAKLKKQVESGEIRTTGEFKRRLLMMFANAVMYNSTGHDVNIYAKEMAHDSMAMLNELMAPNGSALNTAEAAKLRRISRGADTGRSLRSL
uniref:Bromo domain-containing protein n=1 Tax=Plectus sambesii TaxID=2011161 RepID=A0A914X430_9BILA